MGRKVICRKPGSYFRENVTGQKAFHRPFAEADENALPPLYGRADARQPGETASRLPRIIPVKPESAICRDSFAALESLSSRAELSAVASLYILDIELHLLQIARSRASRDFEAVAREAQAVGRIVGNLGAERAGAAARLLEQACHRGNHGATYRLIGDLSQTCDELGTTLNEWMAIDSAARRP